MGSDMLAKILEAEREIQTKIDTARKTGEERIHKLKEAGEEKILQEESRIHAQGKRALEETVLPVRQKASAILEEATRKAERLSGLDDETLKEIIMKHIVRILPGERH